MCTSDTPKPERLSTAPDAPLAPPEPADIARADTDGVRTKRKGRKSLRIDLAGGNTSLTPVAPAIPS